MKIPILSRIAKKINNFIDSKIEVYRGNISPHVSKAAALLVFFLIIWTLALLTLVFIGLTIALLIAKFTESTLIGVASVTGFFLIITTVIGVFNQKLVVLPVYRIINIALRGKDPIPGDHVVKETPVGTKKMIPKEESAKKTSQKDPKVKKEEIKSILKNVT